MIKPNVLIVWPKNRDYPLCRWNLTRFRKYFNSVWIAFSEHHQGLGLTNFIRTELSFCNFVEAERTSGDWRDDAVNQTLDKITTEEPILFLEQDFLIKDDNFWEKVLASDKPFIYYKENERIHPAFALVDRKLIEATARDFSTIPGDHFYKFFMQLPQGITLEDLGLVYKEDFYHMAGLTQNYTCFQYGDPFFHPANFLYFNYKSLQFPSHPAFKNLEQQIENQFGHSKKHTFLDRFFPL